MGEESKAKQTIVKTTLVILNGVAFEQVYNPDEAKCQYVFWDEASKRYNYFDYVNDSLRNIRYEPVCEESKWVKNGFIPLPSKPEDYVSFKHLVDEINRITTIYLDIPEERRQLNTYVIILSYMTEKLHAIPYLRALGFKGNGKSRFCDFYGNIAYKSINILLPNMSNIFRLLEKYHGTLVINEDTSPKRKYNSDDENKDLFTLLCSGFERGHPVPRSMGDNYDVEPFDPFGLKILSSYKVTGNEAYESRCINTYMIGTTRADIPIALGKKFLKDTLHLRNMLLDFRLKNFNKDFAEYENQTMHYWGEVSNRAAQCIQPISFLISFDPEIKKFLLNVAEQKYMEDIARDSESFDGMVFKSYVELVIKGTHSDGVCIRDLKISLESKYPDIKPRAISSSLKNLGFKTRRDCLNGKKETVILPNFEQVKIHSKTYLFPDEREEILKEYESAINHKQTKIEITPEEQAESDRIQKEWEAKNGQRTL